MCVCAVHIIILHIVIDIYYFVIMFFTLISRSKKKMKSSIFKAHKRARSKKVSETDLRCILAKFTTILMTFWNWFLQGWQFPADFITKIGKIFQNQPTFHNFYRKSADLCIFPRIYWFSTITTFENLFTPQQLFW